MDRSDGRATSFPSPRRSNSKFQSFHCTFQDCPVKPRIADHNPRRCHFVCQLSLFLKEKSGLWFVWCSAPNRDDSFFETDIHERRSSLVCLSQRLLVWPTKQDLTGPGIGRQSNWNWREIQPFVVVEHYILLEQQTPQFFSTKQNKQHNNKKPYTARKPHHGRPSNHHYHYRLRISLGGRRHDTDTTDHSVPSPK